MIWNSLLSCFSSSTFSGGIIVSNGSVFFKWLVMSSSPGFAKVPVVGIPFWERQQFKFRTVRVPRRELLWQIWEDYYPAQALWSVSIFGRAYSSSLVNTGTAQNTARLSLCVACRHLRCCWVTLTNIRLPCQVQIFVLGEGPRHVGDHRR